MYTLFKLPNNIKLTWVFDQTTYVILFHLQTISLEEVKDYMQTRQMSTILTTIYK
jgi:hypothetical protein